MDTYEKAWLEHFNAKVRENKDTINYQRLVCNPNFNWDLLDLIPFKTSDQQNGNITYEKIWNRISSMKSLTLDIIKMNPKLPWSMHKASKVVPLNDINKNPDFGWNWYKISERTDLTMEFIRCYIKRLNLYNVSHKTDLFIILNNMDFKWNIAAVSDRPDLTLDTLRAHPLLNWNWNSIVVNLHLTSLFLTKEDINRGWNIYAIAEALKITPRIIEQRFPIEYNRFVQNNPDLTPSDVDFSLNVLRDNKNILLSSCSFESEKHAFIEELMIKDAKVIHSEKLKAVHEELNSNIFRADNLDYAKEQGLLSGLWN